MCDGLLNQNLIRAKGHFLSRLCYAAIVIKNFTTFYFGHGSTQPKNITKLRLLQNELLPCYAWLSKNPFFDLQIPFSRSFKNDLSLLVETDLVQSSNKIWNFPA